MHSLQRVAITCQDGSVAIMSFILDPVLPTGQVQREATPENVQAEIDKTLFISPPVSWRLVTDADIPADRTFRNAWRDVGAKVDIDMPAARELHREALRQARVDLLAQLDIQYMQALETNDRQRMAQIVAEKRRLRDVTQDPAIEAATTPDQLKAFWPL